ncbi:DUF6230 family protein [Actinokineospora globicatena]|uniref:Cholesterol esterase n=1 Tax=Actinokineospora globicatena TaxID=103729 RepID=A0A9W6QTX6_9PSEU|nr:DUF6230 family protein [Actinokineospora globicatena]MCP2305537.1 hypothetical protein [Actinokineospora globicatena]GLW81405.1 hypothetical protein Aglo01_58860 [Actinokineospora globicatena]GLW87897.1 hypothetical protein Aglo02_55360 [Actinokineospora globicatena]GLW94574.1 hypothetical protein Aglo03_53900 [Actinokineospora globicatena]
MRGRTQWRKAAVLAVPALALAGVLGAQVARGALASEVVVQGGTLSLSTSGLYGTDFGLSVGDVTRQNADGSTTVVRVGRLGFAEGRLNELCLSFQQQVLGAWFTVYVTGGDGNRSTWEIQTENVELDVVSATGALDMDGVVAIGLPGENVTTIKDAAGNPAPNPLRVPVAEHRVGIDATFAEFRQVRGQIAVMSIPQPFRLPNLALRMEPGRGQCAAPVAPQGNP